jgi:hypothetical protein
METLVPYCPPNITDSGLTVGKTQIAMECYDIYFISPTLYLSGVIRMMPYETPTQQTYQPERTRFRN